MRTEPVALIPDACHVRRSEARAIADALVRVLANGERHTLRLYLGPDGVVGYSFDEGGGEDQHFGPLSLVGTYTRDATATQITDDILAMHREHVA